MGKKRSKDKWIRKARLKVYFCLLLPVGTIGCLCLSRCFRFLSYFILLYLISQLRAAIGLGWIRLGPHVEPYLNPMTRTDGGSGRIDPFWPVSKNRSQPNRTHIDSQTHMMQPDSHAIQLASIWIIFFNGLAMIYLACQRRFTKISLF